MTSRHGLQWFAAVVMGGLVIALFVAPSEALFAYIPRNYNEGWNAFHTLRLRLGGPLYPPLSDAIFINYPPLSFYVVAALHPITGDDIFSGRMVALAAEIVVAVNILFAARALRVDWPIALLAALGFLAFVGVFYEDAVAIDDPQWLGLALQTNAVVILLRRNRFDWQTLFAAALLCLLGGLAKQSLVAVPLAITCWLVIEDRRGLFRWCTICVVLVLSALTTLAMSYGSGFVEQVLLSERRFWLDALVFVGRNLVTPLMPYGLFAIAGLVLSRSDREARLVACYFAVALPIGIGLLAVDGVGYSALFDFTIAAMLGVALALQWLNKHPLAMPAAPLAIALLPALPILALGGDPFSTQAELRTDLSHPDAWRQSIDVIAAADGDVACEMLSLCYWAGRTSAVEFFNFGQYAGLHPEFAEAFAERVGTGDIALIQEDGAGGSRRLPPSVNAKIARAYTPRQGVPTVLLVPLTPGSTFYRP